MAVIKHTIEASVQTATFSATSGQFQTLPLGSYSAPSSAIDNSAASAGAGTIPWLYADFYLTLASITPTAGGYVGLYLLPSLDIAAPSTVYASGLLTAAGTVSPGEGFLVGVFPTVASVGIQTSVITNVPLPASYFKLMVYNNVTPGGGVAFASSGNSLGYRRHNFDVT